MITINWQYREKIHRCNRAIPYLTFSLIATVTHRPTTLLPDWADLLLIAPLSANTLAKISNGFCDDTLSCVIRAWDYGHGVRPGKPLLLTPAMNTAMWEHPLTQSQLRTIQGFWNRSRQVSSSSPIKQAASSPSPACNTNDEEITIKKINIVQIISPQVKKLACGEIGNGALASVDEVLKVCQSYKQTNKKSPRS